jgi:energy-coupling factor transport system permease protein
MHTLTWLIWLVAALVVVGLTTNPLYLLLVLLAVALVFIACHDDRPLARSFRLFFVAGFLIWLGYIVFSAITVGGGRGNTVLLRLPALTLPPLLGGVTLGGAITAEDMVWGAVRGLRIWALIAIFGAFNALVDHYRLLRMTPRSLFHVGLAVTIAITFVPHTVQSLADIREAQRLRGHRFRGLRSYLALVAPLLASSLEQSIQLAEALDARGYGRTRVTDVALGRQQIGVLVGVLLFSAGLFGWLYYGSAATIITLAMMAAGAALLLLAARALGRMVTRTTYRRERWHQRDMLVCGAALGCAAAWIGLRTMGMGDLIYNPYAALRLPPFALIAGMAVLLLAAPALFGAPANPRARRATPTARPASAAAEPGMLRQKEM